MVSFAEIKIVSALRDGFIITTPFTIVGSAFFADCKFALVGSEGQATDVIPKLWAGFNGIITGVIIGIWRNFCCKSFLLL